MNHRYPLPPAEVVEFFRKFYGPTQRSFDALDAGGQAALRQDLEALRSERNRAGDGTTHVEGEYLEVFATRARVSAAGSQNNIWQISSRDMVTD